MISFNVERNIISLIGIKKNIAQIQPKHVIWLCDSCGKFQRILEAGRVSAAFTAKYVLKHKIIFVMRIHN